MGIAVGGVEIARCSGSVMFGDETAYHLRQFGFFGQYQSFPDVPGDYSGALYGLESVVGIDAVLIFGVECRILDFAYVVIEGSCTDKLHICADAACGSRSEVADGHGVVESPRTFFRKLSEQRIVDVAEFNERHARGEAEDSLDKKHHHIAE